MEPKTEYRIITYKTYIYDRYLQFKSTTVIKHWFRKNEVIEVWKFIPKASTIYVLGEHSTEEECPSNLVFLEKSRFIGCHNNYEDYLIGGITWFAEKYPDIKDFFDEMKEKREKYLFEQNAVKETTYLEKVG